MSFNTSKFMDKLIPNVVAKSEPYPFANFFKPYGNDSALSSGLKVPGFIMVDFLYHVLMVLGEPFIKAHEAFVDYGQYGDFKNLAPLVAFGVFLATLALMIVGIVTRALGTIASPVIAWCDSENDWLREGLSNTFGAG